MMTMMSLAQRLSLHLRRVASVSRQGKHRKRVASNQTRLAKSQRRVTLTPASGKCALVKASHTRLLDLRQNCGKRGRGTASEGRLAHLPRTRRVIAAGLGSRRHQASAASTHAVMRQLEEPLNIGDGGPSFSPLPRRNPASQFKLARGVSSCSC